MSNLIIGVVATLIGAIITYIFKENIEAWIKLIFRNIYPNINGNWKVYWYRESSDDTILDFEEGELIEFLKEQGENEEEIKEALEAKKEYDSDKIPSDTSNNELVKSLKQHDIYMHAKIKQTANKVKGSIETYDEGNLVRQVGFTGRITPTRILVLLTEDKTEGHHNFGTILVKLTSDSKFMKGYETFLCSECEDTAYQNIIMEKN